MPYRKTPLFTGGYYHVFNRGNEKRDIFLDRADKERFLKRLEEYLKEKDISLFAYCLMPNHLHLLVRQDCEEGLTKFMRRLGTAHSMYFNKRYERVGSLFQGRFKAKLIEYDNYLLQVSRYIHLNPLELILARLKDGPSQKARPFLLAYLKGYAWSSFNEYLKSPSRKLCNLEILSYFSKENPSLDYRDFVLNGVEEFIEGRLQDAEL